MFITPAFAQGGLSAILGGDNGPMSSFLVPMVLMLVIFYFLMFRPQQKRQKQHQEMIKNVRKGDTVITNGGLVGKVTKVIDDEKVEVELASDVRVVQLRAMLTDVRAKGEPVKEAASS
jgi:preprotein translocase subunit YajC